MKITGANKEIVIKYGYNAIGDKILQIIMIEYWDNEDPHIKTENLRCAGIEKLSKIVTDFIFGKPEPFTIDTSREGT